MGLEDLKGRRRSEDLGLCRRNNVIMGLRKEYLRVWVVFTWFRIGPIDGLL
jgi:hypothetical protein